MVRHFEEVGKKNHTSREVLDQKIQKFEGTELRAIASSNDDHHTPA